MTITTGSDTKEYDGTALTNDVATIVGLVTGETYKLEATGSQTEVGESDNTYEMTWAADGNYYTAKAINYSVTANLGTLKVTASTKQLKVESESGSFTYDGQAHSKYEYTVTYGEETYTVKIADGETTGTATLSTGDVVTITPAESASITHVAESEVANAFSYSVTHSDQYANQTKTEGKLSINPATLTVTTPDAEKVYDGTALTADGTISGFVNNETATFTTTGTQTAVGSSKNSYTLVFDKTAAETDYTVSETVGTLTVTENTSEITVTTTGGTFTYDGQAHGATVAVSTLPTGYTLETATSDDTATHVAEGTVAATCDTLVIKNAAGEDVTDKLNITFGEIQIIKQFQHT